MYFIEKYKNGNIGSLSSEESKIYFTVSFDIEPLTELNSIINFSNILNSEELFFSLVSKDMALELSLTDCVKESITVPGRSGAFIIDIPDILNPNKEDRKFFLTYNTGRSEDGIDSIFFFLNTIDQKFNVSLSPFSTSFDFNFDTMTYRNYDDLERTEEQKRVFGSFNDETGFGKRSELIHNMIHNLMLYVTCHPDWIVRERVDRKVSLTKGDSLNKKEKSLPLDHSPKIHYVDIPESIRVENKAIRNEDFSKPGYSKRFLVRGHWRNQVCGKQRKQRKLTFIAPFWKGVENKEKIEKVYTVA